MGPSPNGMRIGVSLLDFGSVALASLCLPWPPVAFVFRWFLSSRFRLGCSASRGLPLLLPHAGSYLLVFGWVALPPVASRSFRLNLVGAAHEFFSQIVH